MAKARPPEVTPLPDGGERHTYTDGSWVGLAGLHRWWFEDADY